MIADQAKRDVSSMEPRIEKALQAKHMIEAIHKEITQLEMHIKLESEKT